MPITRHGYAERTRNGSTRQHRRERAITLANATHCWLCGEPPRANDPFEADHVVPVSQGGIDHHSNYRPAHRSCNNSKGGLFL